MAQLRVPKTPAEAKRLGLKGLRDAYISLASDYSRILDGKVAYCHGCNEFLSTSSFYSSTEYSSGLFPLCKHCCLKIAEQRDDRHDKPNETKESVQRLLQMMDLPYIDSLYETCWRNHSNELNKHAMKSPIVQYISIIKSLPQYRNKKWRDSEFPIDSEKGGSNSKVKASTIKRFGQDLTQTDYLFLQDQYDSWVAGYECNTKAQEELFERLSFKKLEIFKATREGKSTKDLDESYQKLMNTANITPRQNIIDNMSEGRTLGQLIEKWETERPIPEPSEDLKDVDKLGLYIDVFFKGHLAKMLQLKNPLQRIYENFIKKLTVSIPEYDEDDDSEELFDKIFGKTGEE